MRRGPFRGGFWTGFAWGVVIAVVRNPSGFWLLVGLCAAALYLGC